MISDRVEESSQNVKDALDDGCVGVGQSSNEETEHHGEDKFQEVVVGALRIGELDPRLVTQLLPVFPASVVRVAASFDLVAECIPVLFAEVLRQELLRKVALPVDGASDLHGEEVLERHYKTHNHDASVEIIGSQRNSHRWIYN